MHRLTGDHLGMEIKGFVDLSLVDWDGKLTSVIFLPRCNFRCPYCHNYTLVLCPGKEKTIPFERVESYLTSKRDWLDGVCITGGEPTLHSDLPELCSRIKNIGLPVKLDTNGTNPQMVEGLIEERIVDYIAADIKAPLTAHKYSRAIGVDSENALREVKETIGVLLASRVDYEFRTTVVPTLHGEEDIEEISRDIKGCKKYVLQRFDVSVGKKTLDPAFSELKPFADDEIVSFLEAARKYVPTTRIR
ncbi:MAG: anaerobic ribonucleoside-triphosphate reductase activating protein [Candidatus Bathyarchaeota archaeon]|nr:MAG: anaerobic ribonucleoside-triphosphate reductase activating protein [Candidatus Bathyarchaeota archaeon]